MTSQSWFNSTDESLGMRRQRDSGIVIQNGEMHIGLLTEAKRTSKRPYYKLPDGTVAQERMNGVSNGDVLYSKPGLSARIAAMSGGGGGERHNSNKIRCVSSLCGQGTYGPGNNEILLESLQFQGLAEQGTNDQGANGTSMFNVLRGGIISRINETMWAIEEGDWLEMYCPTDEEAVQGKGAHRTKADLQGERTIWLRPFKPERHRATPKAIYQCLTRQPDDPNAPPAYSRQFQRTCEAYMDSVIQQSALAVAAVDGDQAGLDLLQALKQPANRRALADRLFKRYRTDWQPTELEGSVTTLARLEQEAAGRYIASVGDLVHSVAKNVVAKATSSANPGHMYNCQIVSYGSK